LKQQLMTEQEEEEEKLRWRVDAEVKLALEEFQKAEAQRGAGNQGASCGSIVLRDLITNSLHDISAAALSHAQACCCRIETQAKASPFMHC
jgi:hypothetical protein